MAPSIPTTEPRLLTSNTTWEWAPSFADFPASDGWVVSYRLVGPTIKDFSATNDGSAFSVLLAHTDTNVPPGTYTLFSYATLAGKRYPTGKRTVTVVEGGLVEQQGATRRLWCEQMLEIVEAVLMGKASADMQSYQIAGKSVTAHTLTELVALRASLRHELFTLRTGGRRPTVRVRFGHG